MHRRFLHGRHHGPAPSESRQAAVAIVLCPDEAHDCVLPLTIRPSTLRHHGGQICLPGGRIEKDESAVEAAIREFHEELRPGAINLTLLGILTPVYVYGSNNVVTPIVLIADSPLSLEPDPIEVESVVMLPLGLLQLNLIEERRLARRVVGSVTAETQKQNELTNNETQQIYWTAPHWIVGKHRVWGATAMILAELASLVHETEI